MFKRCLFRCAVAIATLLSSTVTARAGMINGPLGPNLGNAVTYVFIDTLTTAHLELTGSVAANQTFAPLVLITADMFWQATVNLALDEFVDDEINFTVTLLHLAQPHPADDGGLGAAYTTSYQVNAEDFDDGAYNLAANKQAKAHGKHRDQFFNEVFSFTKTTSNFPVIDADEIPTWAFVIDAKHVPEPPLLASLLTGAAMLAARTYRAHRRERPKMGQVAK